MHTQHDDARERETPNERVLLAPSTVGREPA
jgi:hypothetical protein